tara:strand:- start:2764 stop:3129 length:366 start_codon:yes stop_codon:yes gene_type:complete
MNFLYFLNVIIALTIFNVWFLRYNRKTPFRGGDASSLLQEFKVYGLPKWMFYLTGFVKILLSVALIVGIWFKEINILASMLLSFIMLMAVIMHIKVNDPLKKSIPALTILLFLLTIIFSSI